MLSKYKEKIKMYFMKELYTEIEIHADTNKVWKELISTDEYKSWNPFIVDAIGVPQIGHKIQILYLLNKKINSYQVKILHIKDNERFDWLGHFGMKGILDGHHIFELISLNNGSTRLIHKELFSGLLVPFVWNSFLNVHLKKGFMDLNAALKNKVE